MSSDDGNLIIAEEPEEEKPSTEPAPSNAQASKNLEAPPLLVSKSPNNGHQLDGMDPKATNPAPSARSQPSPAVQASPSNDPQPGPSNAESSTEKTKPKPKPKTNAQQTFDFDYNGPPVSVSNAMALELVNRFGLNNAWGAFLKLRGYKIPYDKSIPQPPEHVQALKRFRRKIRNVRETFNQYRDEGQDTDPFMTRDFVIELKGNGEEEKPESPTPAKRKANGKPVENEEDQSASVNANKPNGDVNVTIPTDPTPPAKRQRKPKKDTKKDQGVPLNAPLTIGITPQVSSSGPPSDGVLNKRIDEIVTNVIDRVMSTAGNATASSTHVNTTAPIVTAATSVAKNEPTLPSVTIPTTGPTLQINPSQLPQLSMEQIQEMYRQNSSLFASLPPHGFPIQSLLTTTTLNPTSRAAPPLISPAASMALNQNSSRFFFQNTPGHFVEQTAAQMFLPPTPQPTPSINGHPFPFAGPGLGTASLIRALQIPQPHQVHTVPITNWAQPIQPVVSQIEHKEPKKAAEIVVSQPTTSQPQETSSDQCATPSEKSKTKETPPEPEKSTGRKTPKSEPKKSEESKEEKEQTKPVDKTPTPEPEPERPLKSARKFYTKKDKDEERKTTELQKKIESMEERIQELEENLTAEKQKFTAQKKRMDTMRDKLKKKDDELQTAKIDYACQKTDNITLREQMEKLREENESLKKRLTNYEKTEELDESAAQESDQNSKSPSPVAKRRGRRQTTRLDPSPSVNSRAGSRRASTPVKKPAPRKRKSDLNESAASNNNEEDNEEGNRRQSKRISAARSKILFSSMM
ncbi:unnamed protein product [Bursaphelenchus xylophilus]|uniref:(pine wood nematode) hypothetical protein n=1 Tax=Bursaphelenchus xylophilus TaxID=6326 RepID=A0A1I7RHT8_BURXY|nr:unnamed protein product [Bursaphelenchus xylophilus]CAG9115393.1 unnamed protein product [Bursaphelenchus xylophilus]